MRTPEYDVVIIGAGPAGYSCAIRAAQLQQRVAIIDRDRIGGICVNWGCTPSKAMIESAKIARLARRAGDYGITTGDITVDFARIAERRDSVMAQVRTHLQRLFDHYGITVYSGEAEPVDAQTVALYRGTYDAHSTSFNRQGEPVLLRCKHLVIATGSQPIKPPFVQSDASVVFSNELISIRSLPRELTIIGAGIIGMEFATIFSQLGTQVTMVEYADRVLSYLDPAVSAALQSSLEGNGVRLFLNCQVTAAGQGRVSFRQRSTGQTTDLTSSLILVAIGRSPVSAPWYDRLNLQHTARGITVDDYLQTSQAGIWAIGDSTGRSILAHVGMQQGITCAENIAAQCRGEAGQAMRYDTIPTVVYTLPEIAAVGEVPADLTDVQTAVVPFSANFRAAIEGMDEGFAKVWVKDGRLLAGQIIGEYASEIIQEFTNMIALQTPIEDIARIIHAHPTYAEISRATVESVLGRYTEYVPD